MIIAERLIHVDVVYILLWLYRSVMLSICYVFVLCYPHSSTLPEEHRGAALPLRFARPNLCPLRVSGVELHPGSLLVLQVQSPVEPVCLWDWTLVGSRQTPNHSHVGDNESISCFCWSTSGWLLVNWDSLSWTLNWLCWYSVWLLCWAVKSMMWLDWYQKQGDRWDTAFTVVLFCIICK